MESIAYIFEKAWGVLLIMFGGLVSYITYQKQRNDKWKDEHDKRLDKVEINQASYNQSVRFLVKRFDRIEKGYDSILEKLDDLNKKD